MDQIRAGWIVFKPVEIVRNRVLKPTFDEADPLIRNGRWNPPIGESAGVVHQPRLRQANKAVEPGEARVRAGEALREQPHAAPVRHTEFQYCRWRFFPNSFRGNIVKVWVLVHDSRCRVRPIQPLECSLPQQLTDWAVPFFRMVRIP